MINDVISKRYVFDFLSSALSGKYIIDSKYPDLPQTKFPEIESFNWLEFQLQHQARLQEIRQKPIALKWGQYECWVENGTIHYSKWVKKQREFVKKTGGDVQAYLFGGIGNQLIGKVTTPLIYTDKNGNEFTELEYWDNEQITREEFLDNSLKT